MRSKKSFIFFRKKFAQLNFTPLLCRTKEKNNEQNANNHLGNRNALRIPSNQKSIHTYLHGVYRGLHFKKNSNQKIQII
jgi:hypothetical protein